MPIARSSSNFLNLEFLQKWRHFSEILLQHGVLKSIVFVCLAWLEEDGGSGAWKQRRRAHKYSKPTPPPNNPESTSKKACFISTFLVSFYMVSTKLIGSGVLKLLSPQNLGNFSFKESSKLKREITLKNLDGKFQSWLIKILKFNTLKPNVRSMNSKLQFHN